MKNTFRNLAVVALLALVATASAGIRRMAPEAVRKQVEVSMLLAGTIDIEPDGSVSGYTLEQSEKVPGYVVELLDRRVPAWRFEPTLRDGRAVPVRSSMSVRMVARPTGEDGFALSISGVEFGEYDDQSTEYLTRDRMDPPKYPMAAVRMGGKGTVYLVLRVNRDGRVADLFVEQVNLTAIGTEPEMVQIREHLAKAATGAAWKWTFHPPTTGETVDDEHWSVRVPVAFELDRPETPRYGKWQAYLPGPRQTASWAQDGASPDAIAAGGLRPVGGGVKLLTPLQDG